MVDRTAAGHRPTSSRWTHQARRNRVHIDVWVPYDQAGTRSAVAIAAGGRLVTDAHAPSYSVLADREGNEAQSLVVMSAVARRGVAGVSSSWIL
ncbi:VOC family protein [Streptomyces sp. NPDC054783]